MRAALLLLAAGAFVLAGPVGSAAPLPDSPVLVVGMNFTPNVMVVPSGGTVTWTSLEPQVGFFFHYLYATGGVFSGPLPEGGTFSAVLDVPSGSVVPYTCFIHSQMLGYVVVV
jgi:plastocyanin